MLTNDQILEGIENSLKRDFEEIYKVKYNPNTKGHGYEKIVSEFLETYLGNFFNFYVRVPIYDSDLKCRKIFRDIENEFDVVVTYKTSIPRIAFEIKGTAFIPYDTVAFVIEVKQDLTKEHLQDDSRKLKKLGMLKLATNSRQIGINTDFGMKRPMRILFYYEKHIEESFLWETIKKFDDTIDFLLILSENKLFLNKHLPVTKRVVRDLGLSEAFSVIEQKYPFLKLMYYVTLSIRYPFMANAWTLFENLFNSVNSKARSTLS
jgi:hypothetical protein